MILVSDYDGTLKIEKNMRKEDIEAIKRFQEAGHLFVISTGRTATSIHNTVTEQGIFPDYYICFNGSVILDKHMNVITRELIDFDVAMTVLNKLQQLPLESLMITDGIHYSIIHSEGSVEAFIQHLKDPLTQPQTIIENKEIAGFIFKGDEKTTKDFLNHLQQLNLPVVATQNMINVDIMSSHVNKAIGCLKFQKIINEDHLEVIGDDLNDLEMIQQFSGFAIKSGRQEVLDVCNISVATVDECINILLKNS